MDPFDEMGRVGGHVGVAGGVSPGLVELAPETEIAEGRPATEDVGPLGEMGIEE